jgi:glutaryl-CoA dehydrogenase (non-decarboxylating)
MDFSLTEEHKLIEKAAKDFGFREISPTIKENDAKNYFDKSILKKLGDAGFLGICIPKKYGGQGADYISLGLVCQGLERVDSSLRVIMSVHTGLNSLALLQWGTEEQKKKYLIPQAKGEKIAGFGLTEPNAGSDVMNIQATAKKEGDFYILNGEKTWISLADVADNFLVFAKMGEKVSAFIVERSFKGFSSSSIHGKLGMRAGNTGSISFQDLKVPKENLLGKEGDGIKIALSAIDSGRFTVAAGAVGLIEACLEESVIYAKQREAFGKEIGKHELVQQMIGKMAASLEVGKLLVYKAGWLKNEGMRNTKETSLAKWVNCNNAFDSANDAIQIFGAYGYSNEFNVERYFRNSRGAVIYEGTREIHTILQAEYALGYREDKPLSNPLPAYPSE